MAAGQLCSSTRAELFAVRSALQRIEDGADTTPVIVFSDSRAAAQTSPIGAEIWSSLRAIAITETVWLLHVSRHLNYVFKSSSSGPESKKNQSKSYRPTHVCKAPSLNVDVHCVGA